MKRFKHIKTGLVVELMKYRGFDYYGNKDESDLNWVINDMGNEFNQERN